MADEITKIWLIDSTSSRNSAGTNDVLTLRVTIATATTLILDTTNTDAVSGWGSTSDPGDASIWLWSQDSGAWSPGTVTSDNITAMTLGINGTDAWTPSAIFVLAQDGTGKLSFLAGCGDWSSAACFSQDMADCNGKAQETYDLLNLSAGSGPCSG